MDTVVPRHMASRRCSVRDPRTSGFRPFFGLYCAGTYPGGTYAGLAGWPRTATATAAAPSALVCHTTAISVLLPTALPPRPRVVEAKTTRTRLRQQHRSCARGFLSTALCRKDWMGWEDEHDGTTRTSTTIIIDPHYILGANASKSELASEYSMGHGCDEVGDPPNDEFPLCITIAAAAPSGCNFSDTGKSSAVATARTSGSDYAARERFKINQRSIWLSSMGRGWPSSRDGIKYHRAGWSTSLDSLSITCIGLSASECQAEAHASKHVFANPSGSCWLLVRKSETSLQLSHPGAKVTSISSSPSMSSTDSPDASASQPSRKSRWNPFRSSSSKSGPKLASVISAGDKRSHEAVNIHISGGQGGSRGSGGVHGGGGGTGEGPTLQYNIKAEHFTVHAMNTGSDIVQASQAINYCPPPSQIFQGRQAILDSMHQFFTQDTGKQKRYVLYGLGGAGKTQIALKFIKEWTKSSFTDQLLVDASNTDTIETALRNIAMTKKAGNSWKDILFWLASRHEEWLLFFDNADDPQINLNQFFPKCGHGNIIITSRNPNLRVYGGHSHVSDMEESDAVALLLKSAQYATSATNETLATEIVKVLCYFPLAIVQAGAFILESEALETYLDLFSKNRTELLKRKPTQMLDDYAWAVYTTWEMSFSKLSAPAVMFLQLCSFLHQDDISENIFARAANYIKKSLNQPQSLSNGEIKLEEFLSYFLGPSGDWDSFEFLKLTNEIKAYSLISYNTERNLRLVSHVDSLMQVIPKLTTNFQEQYARTYYFVGQYTKAETLQLSEAERCRKCSGDDHPDTLRAMHRLAMTYTLLGQYEEAEKLYATVLAKQKMLFGDGSPETLHTIHDLAITYDKLYQFEMAEKLYAVVLEKQKTLLGDDHPDTLLAMHNFAITYDNLGQFEEAKKLKIEVLEKRRKLLGDAHPDTLQTMHNLAMTYDNLGQFEEAEELKVVVLEKRRKLLGDDHPDTLWAMNNLAVTYYNLGRFEEAEILQVVVLEKRRKVLGDDHQDTLNAMQNLAFTYDKLGQTEEAEKLRAILLEKDRKL
ncbi:hypothetical protein C8R45DRAFT_1083915 [Mycena sanguinolenta]|nr:hypothetical protein C8R45DRAFT_1083915 [Mycena sanguinolenta]